MVSQRAWVTAFGDQTPYQKWQETEGIPSVKGFYVEDLTKVPLAPERGARKLCKSGGLGAPH